MVKKNLIVQYYIVHSADESYNKERQKEIDTCLLYNLQNKYLDEVHILSEACYSFDFIPNELRTKIKQTVIGSRLTYQAAFEYYNECIPNTTCILANADIFTDESLDLLVHLDFTNNVLALNRYEFDSEETASLLYGSEINYKNSKLLSNNSPSPFGQDAWIWNTSKMPTKDTDFTLGSWTCDNRIAYILKQNGLIVYNPSYLLSINHFDRLSIVVSPNGSIQKGTISKKKDTAPEGYKASSLQLVNIDDSIDRFTTSSSLVHVANPVSDIIHSVNINKTIKELHYVATASSHLPLLASFRETGAWTPSDATRTIEFEFDATYCIRIIDIKGKPCSYLDKTPGHVSSLTVSYLSNDTWISYTDSITGISRRNGNFIKRNYLTSPFYCKKCRITVLGYDGSPSLKVRFFGDYFNVTPFNDSQLVSYNAEWQKPVITEYNVYKQLLAANKLPYNYFAFPWATFIDEAFPKLKKLTNLKPILDSFKRTGTVYCTVVQHIRFMRIVEVFKSLNILHVFTPHCTLKDKEIAKTYGIELYVFPLYAAVKRGLSDSIIPLEDRRYVTSFIGQYDARCYLTDIRLKIFDLFAGYADCLITRRGEWHYQGTVYRKTGVTDASLEGEYKEALAHSKFSLCPSGSGPNSIRIWESMSFGSIPVILADTLVMPTIRTMAWSDAVIFWKEGEIDSLYAHLKSMSKEEMESKSKACLELFDTYFSDEAFCRVLFEHFATV